MIELILIILVILVVAAVSIFAWVDYNKHKKSNETDFTKVDKNIKTEGETRLSNLKFVVDQVNKTNEEMDTTYVKKFGEIETTLTDYNSFKSGFGSLLTVRNRSSNVDIPITNLANVPATDVNMIKHVSFLGGATIKDLQASVDKADMRLKVCGTGDKPACIELPNADGDTYLTSLVSGKGIVFDAPVKAYNSFGLYAPGEKAAATVSLQAATADQTNVTMGDTGALSVRAGTSEVLGIRKGDAKVTGSVTLQNASGKSAILSVNENGDLNIVGANKVIVGEKEMAFVATNQIDVNNVVNNGVGDNINVNETFCTLPANQGKNYQCTDEPYKSMNIYFQLLDGEVLSYNKWNQAVENAAVSKVTLTAEGYNNCAKVQEQCKMNNMKRPKYDE